MTPSLLSPSPVQRFKRNMAPLKIFMTAVKAFYDPVYRPQRTGGYTSLYVMDGQLTQPVLLVGPDGDFVVALYAMQRQRDGDWKILGCSLIP